MFTVALSTTAKTWKQPKCSLTDEWIKTTRYIYTVEYYSAIRKNKIMPSAAISMNLEIIKLSESTKDKYHMISYICEILKNDTNEFIYKIETDSQT